MPDPPNATIAELFDELADLYELDGAVVHRVLAYRNAAKAVREAPRSVSAMTREGTVTQLPGIGKTLQDKLVALLDTGEIPSLTRLRGEFPPGLIEMTRLPLELGSSCKRKVGQTTWMMIEVRVGFEHDAEWTCAAATKATVIDQPNEIKGWRNAYRIVSRARSSWMLDDHAGRSWRPCRA